MKIFHYWKIKGFFKKLWAILTFKKNTDAPLRLNAAMSILESDEPRFYLVEYVNRRPPEALNGIRFIHIKGTRCGEQVLILTKAELVSDDAQELTLEEAKQLLADWLALDIANEPTNDVDGNPITYTVPDLDAVLSSRLMENI